MRIFSFFLSLIGIFATHSLSADEFPFNPPYNFTLDSNYIGMHHPVSTSDRTAQLYFDQGFTLLYAFNHDAAYWSFLRASEADPKLAMAYWGMSLALGSNINMTITPERSKLAYTLIQKAIHLSKDAPANEQDYILALSKRYAADPNANLNELALTYSQAMRELSNKYPDDPDAAVLFAESLLNLRPWDQWTEDGRHPLPGTLEAVSKLESVLKREPMHIGANHYYIHAVEASSYPERALMSAERLRKLVPASGHLLHMPSHIYLLVGDYHQAALSNEEAVAQDRAYIQKYGIQGIYPIHYLSHNLYFLSRAYAMEGNFTKAMRAAEELASLYLPHFHRMPLLEYYASTPLFTLLRFQQWKALLQLPPPAPSRQVSNAIWHFGRAIAFAHLGAASQSREEQKQFRETSSKLPSELLYGYNQASNIIRIATLYLDATLAEQDGNQEQAIQSLRKAITEQDKLHYNEPPDWFFPIRESLGGLLIRMNQFDAAETIFREELQKHPRNGRALFGLKETLAAQRRFYDYYWIDQEFQKAWMYSDSRLSVEKL
jgi:hypothetical protein